MNDFGKHVVVSGMAVTGEISRHHGESIPVMIELAQEIVKTIGMTVSHPAEVTDYPPDPLCNVSPGFMIYQPLYESFVVLDVWPPHQCIYIHVASCKPFDSLLLWNLIESKGFAPKSTMEGQLWI